MYKTRQASHTFDGVYEPGTTGTESLYERIDIENEGTIDNPIPYEPPMEIFEGKYYTEDGVTYLCTRDSGVALTHALSALVGQYVTAM